MEGADQVLAAHQIHARLPADSGIHLGEKRSGNLQHRDPAHENCGQKAAHIVDDAAAIGDHHARPIRAARHHLLGELL